MNKYSDEQIKDAFVDHTSPFKKYSEDTPSDKNKKKSDEVKKEDKKDVKYTEEQMNKIINIFAEKTSEEPTPDISDVETEMELKKLSFKSSGKKIDVIDGKLYINDEPVAKIDDPENLDVIIKLIQKLSTKKAKEEKGEE